MEVIYKKTVVDELKKVLLNADCRDKVVEKIVVTKEEFKDLYDDAFRTKSCFGVKEINFTYGNFNSEGEPAVPNITGNIIFYFKSLHGLTKKATFTFEVQ